MIIFICFLLLAVLTQNSFSQLAESTYGMDVSWPIQHSRASSNFAWLPHNVNPEEHPIPKEFIGIPVQPLGDRQKFYEEVLQGCRDFYKERGFMCDLDEESRLEINLRQPSQMTNYTEMGFKKIRAPAPLFQLLKDFWDANKHLAREEELGVGYTTINNWAVPTYTVDVDDRKLKGGGFELVKAIESMASQVIYEWTGVESEPTFVYGIRSYHNGSILMPHVDDLPRISSMIVNVDQDVDEDWPLEVYGHDGKAYNVTTKPGEMVLYESHSVLHGRPFPLKGRFYANIFIHFAPGKNQETARQAVRIGDLESLIAAISIDPSKIHERDENGWQLLHEAARGGFEDLVEYLVQNGADVNSPTSYDQTALDIALGEHGEDHPVIQMLQVVSAKDNVAARYAARTGDYSSLKESILADHSSIHVRDGNGWQVIHEAVLGGSEEALEFLVENGADLNSATYYHGTPLDIALEHYGEDNPIIKKLRDLGAFSSTDEESDEL